MWLRLLQQDVGRLPILLVCERVLGSLASPIGLRLPFLPLWSFFASDRSVVKVKPQLPFLPQFPLFASLWTMLVVLAVRAAWQPSILPPHEARLAPVCRWLEQLPLLPVSRSQYESGA